MYLSWTLVLVLMVVPGTQSFLLRADDATKIVRIRARRRTEMYQLPSKMEEERVLINQPYTISSLDSLHDFMQFIDESPRDSLAVIKFHANSCQMCKRVQHRYQKLARYFKEAPISFARVEKSVHPDIFVTLNVQTYPFIQVYRNGLCVASHGIQSEKTFEPMLHDTIQKELDMSPDNWESFLEAFSGPIRESTNKLEKLRSLLSKETSEENNPALATSTLDSR